MNRKIAALTGFLMINLMFHTSFAKEEGEDIAHRRGNPSPSQSESNINEYTFQDEQINLGPDDQDVLVLRTDQKNLLNRFVTRSFKINHVVPIEIVKMFDELVSKEGGRAEVIRDKKTKDNWLQVIAPEWQMPGST